MLLLYIIYTIFHIIDSPNIIFVLLIIGGVISILLFYNENEIEIYYILSIIGVSRYFFRYAVIT